MSSKEGGTAIGLDMILFLIKKILKQYFVDQMKG